MKKIFLIALLLTGVFLANPLIGNAKEAPKKEIPVTMFKTEETVDAKMNCPSCKTDLLEKAIKYTFCTNDLRSAMDQMEKSSKFYYAQNDIGIKNGTFDIHQLFTLKQLCDAKKIKITVTLAYDGKNNVTCANNCKKKCKCPKEEFSFGLYKNIDKCELTKKFTSRQFKHKYLMKNHLITLKELPTNSKNIQKFESTVDLCQICNKNEPLYAVITFMDDCFKFKIKKDSKNGGNKCKNYAYLIEVEKIN